MARKYVFTFMLLLTGGIAEIILSYNATTTAKTISSFNITTIAAVDNASVLQCWQITLPLTPGAQVGLPGAVIQSLGQVSSMQWASLPANYAGTAHPASVVQYNAFLSGETLITIPGSTQQVTIIGGKYGLLLATDTAAVSATGHISSSGRYEVTGVMIPTQDGVLPSHNVLHDGPCTKDELNY